MPTGVYKRTKPIWNKGKKCSTEWVEKNRLSHLGKSYPRTPEGLLSFKEKMSGNKNPMFGKHLSIEVKEKLRQSHLGKKQSKETIEKRVKQFRNENHWTWKGDEAGYRAIHLWVETRLGKPRFCENCGNKDLKHRQYNWANIDHNYKRIITDWRRLCVKCHNKFDRDNQKKH